MRYYTRRLTKRELRHNGPVYVPVVEVFKTRDEDIAWAQKGLRIPFCQSDNPVVKNLLQNLQEDCIYTFKASALD